MRFDPATNELAALPLDMPDPEQPAVSHNGALLAFIASERLYLFDGSRVRPISVSGKAHDPSFGPHDKGIVFASDGYIGLFDLAHQAISVLRKGDTELASPSISPDGRTLLFAALQNSNWQVRIKDLATGQERGITAGSCNNVSPAWRPASRQVVFASDCGRGLGLPALYLTPTLDRSGNFTPKSLDSEARVPFAAAIH
jgi:Tol biopolymer transport system component